jgi:hypothetical protein
MRQKPHAREVTMLRAGTHRHKRRVLVQAAVSSDGTAFFSRHGDVLDERSPRRADFV